MKSLSISVFVGLLLAAAIIYWLEDLNPGAVALIILLSISFVDILRRFIGWIIKRRSKNEHAK